MLDELEKHYRRYYGHGHTPFVDAWELGSDRSPFRFRLPWPMTSSAASAWIFFTVAPGLSAALITLLAFPSSLLTLISAVLLAVTVPVLIHFTAKHAFTPKDLADRSDATTHYRAFIRALAHNEDLPSPRTGT